MVHRGEVSEQDVPVVHHHLVSVEQILQVHAAHLVLADVYTHRVVNVLHVFLADEFVLDAEAAAMLERMVQITWAHQHTMLVLVAPFRCVSLLMVEMLNDDWVAGAHLKPVSMDALAQEDLDALLVTDLDPWLHREARTVPEVVQVALADPLLGPLSVVQVFCCQLDALVVLHVQLQLVVADHRVTEQTVVMTRLLLLIVDHLVSKIFFDSLMDFVSLLLLMVLQNLVSRRIQSVMTMLGVVFSTCVVVVMVGRLIEVLVLVMDDLIVVAMVLGYVYVDINMSAVVGVHLFVMVDFVYVVVRVLDLSKKACMLEDIVDRGVRLSQNMRIR